MSRCWAVLIAECKGPRVDDPRIVELQNEAVALTETLRKSEERATAGQLALELMHEIRNPLEALGHLTYLAREESTNPEAVRRYLLMADEQLVQLRHIASQTLGFARSSASTKPMCLVVLTEAALRVHQRAIEAKRIHIVRQLPDRLQASVYRGELLQAISNLIINAIDALENGGTLCLRLRKHEGAVCLTIADNGHGIAPKQTSSIFEPFFSTKGEKGTGLGLALTRKIIDHHQGSIRVRSSVQPNRRGTSFRLRIPA